MFKVGDKVKITGLAKKFNGKLGWITRINGGYIYVKLRWQRHQYDLEVYDVEIEYA